MANSSENLALLVELHDEIGRLQAEKATQIAEWRATRKKLDDLRANQVQFVTILNRMLSGTQVTSEYFGALKDVLAVARGCGIE